MECSSRGQGLLTLIASDYRAHYAYKRESEARLRSRMLPRLIANASLHMAVLVRLSQRGPRPLRWLWRRMLLSMHASDVADGLEIGPGIQFPHPFGIAIGAGTSFGANVVIHHNLTIGPDRRWHPGEPLASPVVGDGVVFGPNTTVMGGLHLGTGAVVGAGVFLTEDLPEGALCTRSGTRLAGEWEDQAVGTAVP